MSTDIAIRNVELSNEQLQFIAHTEFVPVGLRGNVPAILACVSTGRALGLPDMTALRSIHIIDGKATFSAELMVMLVRRAGHSIVGESADGTATAIGTRADNGDTITVTWTRDMADRAGLLNKRNWKQYEESMLWARAVSQLCRMLFADCMGGGATYTPEELEESVGEPSADALPPVEADASGSVAQAAREGEPASPTEQLHAAAKDLPPADLADPDIPFGDAAQHAHQPHNPASVNQRKKLDVLVKGGKAPPELRRVYATVARMRKTTTGALIVAVGGDEDGTLHWSPLRDSLSFGEAHELIDRLERLEKTA